MSINLLNVQILSLMDDELKVQFDVWHLLSSPERTLFDLTLLSFQKLLNRFVQYRFNVIDYILNYLMMHPGKDYNLKERLYCPQEIKSIWPYLVYKRFANTIDCVLKLATIRVISSRLLYVTVLICKSFYNNKILLIIF